MRVSRPHLGALCSWASRAALASSLAVLGLALTGCHHRHTVAYQPPPPGIDTSRSSHRAPIRPQPVPGTIARTPELDDTTRAPVYSEVGMASWYGPPYHHRAAADGSIYDQNAMTAAHRTLPMGSTVRVTNVATGQSVVVRITDRGPFVPGRILDLSLAAAKAIGVWRAGVARVKVEAFAHPAADPAGRWCVQIGAFRDVNDALDLRAELIDRYRTAKVIEFAGPTGYWVRINPAKPDHTSATEIARSLQPSDPKALPYVVRVN